MRLSNFTINSTQKKFLIVNRFLGLVLLNIFTETKSYEIDAIQLFAGKIQKQLPEVFCKKSCS